MRTWRGGQCQSLIHITANEWESWDWNRYKGGIHSSTPNHCATFPLMGMAGLGGANWHRSIFSPLKTHSYCVETTSLWAASRPPVSWAGMQRSILFPGEKVLTHLITNMCLKALWPPWGTFLRLHSDLGCFHPPPLPSPPTLLMLSDLYSMSLPVFSNSVSSHCAFPLIDSFSASASPGTRLTQVWCVISPGNSWAEKSA